MYGVPNVFLVDLFISFFNVIRQGDDVRKKVLKKGERGNKKEHLATQGEILDQD